MKVRGIVMSRILAKDLNFSYENKYNVLKNLTFEINEGESIGLIGANGAGKSTLLKLMVGLLENYQGTFKISEFDVNKKNIKNIRNEIGYVFQDSDSQLFMTTVYDDVAFGPKNLGCSKKEVEERVMRALKQVHIEELKDRPVYKMSGGQKKLASIATILSMSPSIILLDEPSIALDPRNRRNLINILNEMKVTKLIASHDLDLIKNTCEKVIFLNDGEICYNGFTAEIIDNEDFLIKNGL